MLITLVTYNRPKWARRIIAHLRKEAPDALIAVCNNGGLQVTDEDRESGWLEIHGRPPTWRPKAKVVIYQADGNLGGGGGRNELLKMRQPGEPFVRIDDDWLPRDNGWLSCATVRAKESGAGLVRVGPMHKMEERVPPPLGGQWRGPDCCGPIWLVTGECADALGGFYLGFGKTLLDDLEYSRRAAEWQRHFRGKRRVFEFGWPIDELGNVGRFWAPPWPLFLARCRKIERGGREMLHVPLDQPTPGWEQRDAGLNDRETTR